STTFVKLGQVNLSINGQMNIDCWNN
ncbi:deoxyribodipyrimidine photo-lyase-related family protein, partial [Vibrio parahaemolyticus V-223/04]